jgi:hypothetical protein
MQMTFSAEADLCNRVKDGGAGGGHSMLASLEAHCPAILHLPIHSSQGLDPTFPRSQAGCPSCLCLPQIHNSESPGSGPTAQLSQGGGTARHLIHPE